MTPEERVTALEERLAALDRRAERLERLLAEALEEARAREERE